MCAKSNLKAQSAIEYLMTYGWMLLVVAVVGGAVFSVAGGQRIESISGFEENAINVEDFGSSQDQIQLQIANPAPNPVKIKEIVVSQNQQNASIPQDVDLSASSTVVSTPFIVQNEAVDTLDIQIMYDEGGLENLTSSGSITGPYKLEKDKDILAYYSMDSEYADNLLDLSNSDNDAEIRNIDFIDTERGISAKFNPVYDADSDSWTTARGLVEYTSGNSEDYSFNKDDDFTYSAWIKIVGGATDRATYYLGRGHTSSSSGLAYNPASDNILAHIRTRDDANGDKIRATVAHNIEKNRFYHTVMTYDPEKGLSLYIDGELVGTKNDFDINQTEEVELSRGNTPIGNKGRPAGTWSGSPGFGEILDTLVVFNRSLTQEDVLELYERQKN